MKQTSSSFENKISLVAAIFLLGSISYSVYDGAFVYAQESNSIEFPIESLTKILNSTDEANAALSEGDDELVSQNLEEIETEVRDQLSEINVPINDTSSDEIADVLVQEDQ
jgi:hypothetical protein